MPSKEASAKVTSAMRSINRPVLVSELVKFTGFTTNTVKSVLREIGHAEPGYPAYWVIAADAKVNRRLDTVKSRPPVEVAYLEGRNWVKRLSTVKVKRLLSVVPYLNEFTAESDPSALYRDVSEAAAILGSLAYDIQEAKNGPDWYERLGGEL